MDKVLIFYAHPNKDGFSGCFLKNTCERLDNLGREFEVLDLYEMNYNPLLLPKEHYSSGHDELSLENKEIQLKISAANKLIFIYPTWWQNMPAILKGLFDRVLVKGFGFRFNKRGMYFGLLKGRKAVIFTNTGAPKFFIWLLASNRSLRNIKKDILGFCGIKSRAFSIGGAANLTELKKSKIKNQVKKGIAYLFND
ncbi:MAG: flavodoxin family protein [bacterium]|nr:flavodoxin family protein [bacterium]